MSKKASEDFERFIERIHRLIEGQGSKVTWNDHIVDPDNPDRLRQIDISIIRDGHHTHVECRIHKAPQDVQWIEELIGRRASLKADAMIAVSASGFTQGAIKKAKAHGIILRTLDTLSEQEIEAWGKPTVVNVTYYGFTDTEITFRLPAGASFRGPDWITDEHGNPAQYRPLFELVMDKLAGDSSFREADESKVVKINAEVFTSLLVDGVKPTQCRISTSVRRLVRELSLASVVVYVAVDGEDLTANAYVQKYDASGFEILQNSDEVAVVVDLSNVATPQDCLLRTVNFDFGRVVTMTWFQTVGLKEAMDYSTSVAFRFEWE